MATKSIVYNKEAGTITWGGIEIAEVYSGPYVGNLDELWCEMVAAPVMLKALERCVGELVYAAEKLPYSNAKEALKIVQDAIKAAKGITDSAP